MASNQARKSEVAPILSIALAGNPNSGKTSIFNSLTGLRFKVGNYPGITVERKSGTLFSPDDHSISAELVDLPGIYSLGGFSDDEKVTTGALLGLSPRAKRPNVILFVADSSNLEKSLFLLSQILDLNIPTVVALSMTGLAERMGVVVYPELLSKSIGAPVVEVERGNIRQVEELKKLLFQASKLKSQPIWNKKQKELSVMAERVGHSFYRPEDRSLALDNTVSGPEYIAGLCLISGAILSDEASIQNLVREARSELGLHGVDPSSAEFSERYTWANEVVNKTSKKQVVPDSFAEKLDVFLTHKYTGFAIFTLIMSSLFQGVFLGAEPLMGLIESGIEHVARFFTEILPPGPAQSLLVDGVVVGVGNVIVFVPQIAILFFFLGLLGESGYLARAAYVMDRAFRPFGLQGRSFVPLLSSFACAIPGILSARTISSRRDRLITILIAPLMSCSARLPVYSVLIAAFIPANKSFLGFSLQGLVFLAMYLLGIIAAALVALVLKLSILKGKPSLFVMEMPRLRVPQLNGVLREVYDRVLSFLMSAGTMILACSVVLWFFASYPKLPEGEVGHTNALSYSFAGRLGKVIEPVIEPLGFDWQIGVSILASFAAREVFVSSMATIHNLDPENETASLTQTLSKKYAKGEYTLATGLSLMVFYVFACQCMSTLAVTKKETGSWGWVILMFSYMTALAYGMAFITYRLFC